MKTLFTGLFETFSGIADAKNGTIGSQKSLYSIPASQSLPIAIEQIKENEKEFSNGIKRERARLQSAISSIRKTDVLHFDKYSGRVAQQFDLNGIYSWDKSVQKALSELITCAYLSSTEEGPKIYSDLSRAKQTTEIIFNKLVKTGLRFPTTDIGEEIKTAILATVFDINSNKKDSAKPDDAERQNNVYLY